EGRKSHRLAGEGDGRRISRLTGFDQAGILADRVLLLRRHPASAINWACFDLSWPANAGHPVETASALTGKFADSSATG
ncbi:MAG: hypothetical protein J0H79_03400, partial [Alphaproteobacteria bacterium]|nr:hypothetical protein [Alphaproteobacteria bacterium]